MLVSLGKFKGKTIFTPNQKTAKAGYRPTTAKHRQMIFNIIQHSSKLPNIDIAGAKVADLCCGSGALGFEALSLGAAQAVFMDNSQMHLKFVRETLDGLALTAQATLLCRDVSRLPAAPFACDIVFLDPPYHQNNDIIGQCLAQLRPQGWLAQQHVIVVEAGKWNNLARLGGLTVLDERSSGKTKLLFLGFIDR